MAELYSQYASGVQFTAGTIVGSALGTSGINAVVDRLNSISTADNLVNGSIISGTNVNIFVSGIESLKLSGTSLVIHTSGGIVKGGSQNYGFPGASFMDIGGTNVTWQSTFGYLGIQAAAVRVTAPISLPDKAILNSAVVYGDAAGETWSLEFTAHTGSASETTIASANIQTVDTTITHTIDNATNRYWIDTSTLDSGARVFGGNINYSF